MTEEEWLECKDPHSMLELRDKVTDRKSRLFACACIRRVWDLIESDLHRRAVEVAERFADGAGSILEWKWERRYNGSLFARDFVRRPIGNGEREWAEMLQSLEAERKSLPEDAYFFSYENVAPMNAVAWTLYLNSDVASVTANHAASLRASLYPNWKECRVMDFTPEEEQAWNRRHRAEGVSQANLLRCIFGPLPFRSVTLDRKCLTPTIKQLAEVIYQERQFDRLGILADALEEAGCSQTEVLAHLRSNGEHVRGCWALDLVMGKA
jgi:hypothetical protein